MFKPQPIVYEEDKIRQEFYSDHPWELARPRIVVETDGRDGQKCNWSRMQQRGRPLNGERYGPESTCPPINGANLCSVVQRQLWLMKRGGMSRDQAYDVARKEFYALRQEEEIERRIAKEEAAYVGAYFGKSVLEIGAELEDKSYEAWKDWATKEVGAIERQRDAAYTGVGTANEDNGSSEVVNAEEQSA